jgi:Tol biopolymer transport system component
MFLHDRVGMNTSRVDRPMANGTETYAYASGPDFSDAGLLVYASNENNLAEGDTDGLDDIYVFNVFTGGNVPIELTHPGAPALEYEWAPAISADGRYVTFMGVTVGEWSNYLANVYVVDRQTGQSYEISVRPDGSRDDHASAPAISADGLSIAFSAGAEMLQWGWGNTGVFVATNVALSPSEIDVPRKAAHSRSI